MTKLFPPFFALLLVIGSLTFGLRSSLAAGSVSVTAWTCPEDIDQASDDPMTFSDGCPVEATDLTFALTSGEITRRRVTAEGKPASWPSVTGKLTIELEKPENENAALVCALDGADPNLIEVKNASAELDLTTGTSLDCQWYRLPAKMGSPVASPSIPPVKTAISTSLPSLTPSNTPTRIPSPIPTSTLTPTATATDIPTSVPTETATSMTVPSRTATSTSSAIQTPTLPPTETLTQTSITIKVPTLTSTTEPTATASTASANTPTLPPTATPQPTTTTPPTATPYPTATEVPTQLPTATATKEPGPKALSTQIAVVIAANEPNYHLDLHQMTYELGDEFLVYPDPDGPQEGQFAVKNFVLVATFINPPRDDDGIWDYGILFGPTTIGDNYRFTVFSTGGWLLFRGSEIDRQGDVEGLLVDFRERNTLKFIVSGDRAILYLNDELVASVRLDDREDAGQLWLVTTNKDSNEIAFLDLDVWSIP